MAVLDSQLKNNLSKVFDQYLAEFRAGKRVTSDLQPELYKILNKYFNTDFTERIKLDYYDNKELIKSLSDNLEKWNKARNYKETDELTKLLYDAKLNNLTDATVTELIAAHKTKWLETWLETEVKTMHNSVENLNNWNSFQPDARLMYSTAKDLKVRDEHAALDGMVLPKSDLRWQYLSPPPSSSPWNCRCRLVAVWGNVPSTDVTQRVEQMSKDMKVPVEEIKKGKNAAFSGKIYNEDVSHFKNTPKYVYAKL
jgi:SPP1 gp7 family putative phage head morphogenesis protein